VVLGVLASASSWLLAAAPARADGTTPPANASAVSIVESIPTSNVWLAPQHALTFTPGTPSYGLPVIGVEDTQRYQVIRGFGGAMTDSSAWLIEDYLPQAARTRLLDELFGAAGIHLDFVRVPIGASDFTATGVPYSYDDMPAGETDPTLAHFSIRHDYAYIIPSLKQVLEINPSTELMASPWTAPAWMKRNDSLSNIQNKGTLIGSYYGAWARYIVKFLQAYAGAGVLIAAITPQNEPGNPTPYPGMNLSADSLVNWTVRDLAPALSTARLHTQVYGLDFGWGSSSLAYQLAAGETAEFSGVAWHCYYGSPDVMAALHTELPNVSQIVDECSPGITPIPTSEVVISSLREWASTVALWNFALNRVGGPVEHPNQGCPGCYGLATIVPRALGSVRLTPAYYELGQASAAIEPGAVRVASNNFVGYDYLKPGVNFITPSVDDVAAVNPDGTRVLMAYNNGLAAASFAVEWDGEYFDYTLPGSATVTFKWDA